MPEAAPTDVRVEIDTRLDDPDVSDILDRVEREWQREYEAGDFDDTQHIQDFEAVLAALRIAEGRDRRASEESRESASITYEADEVESLRERVRRVDPGDVFGHTSTVVRDADRHSGIVNLE
jgi:hypothetical protein